MKIIFKKPLRFTVIVTLCLVVVTLFATTGCDKSEKTDENEVHFYAKVENSSQYSNVVEVKLMMYDGSIDGFIELARGNWKGDGFTIVLPKTVDPNYLGTSIYSNELPTTIIGSLSTLTIIGNKNVKVVGNAYFWGYDKDGNRVARFSPYDNTFPIWDGIPHFTYADSDVAIFGYIEEDVFDYYHGWDLPILYEWKKTTTYSIEWKKGWNAWRLTGGQSLPEVGTITENWSTIPNDEVKWYGGENY